MKNLVKISLVLAAAALTLSGCNCFKKMGKKKDLLLLNLKLLRNRDGKSNIAIKLGKRKNI